MLPEHKQDASLVRILPPDGRWIHFLRAADRKHCGVHGGRTSRLLHFELNLAAENKLPLFEEPLQPVSEARPVYARERRKTKLMKTHIKKKK